MHAIAAVIVKSRVACLLLFFFSSRRRHTRLQGDWSSDVCSSDLRRDSAHSRRDRADAARSRRGVRAIARDDPPPNPALRPDGVPQPRTAYAHQALRSEEHTSELQSPCNLVCRLLLEKKK